MDSTVQKVLVLPDIHCPNHDNGAINVALEFKNDFKPHTTILLGDLIDADCVSSFDKYTTVSQAEEYQIAKELLTKIRPQILLEGNHEERFRRPSAIKKELWELLDPKRWFEVDKRKIRWVPYSNREKDIFRIGHMSFIHGFSAGQYAVADEARMFGCVCHGHTHRIAQFTPRHAYYSQTGFNIGTLSKLDLEYQTTCKPSGWAQGFAFGYFYRGGGFSFYQVRLIGREFFIEGKRYLRS